MGSVSPIPSACTTTGMRVTADDCGGDDGRLATLLDQYEPEWAVRQWGFDTIVFRFKLDHPQAVASLVNPFAFGNTDPRADPTEGTFDPDTGSPRAVTVRDSGNWMMNLGFAQVSGFPQTGLVNVQCRPSALIAQDEENRDLAHPTDLVAGAAVASALVCRILGGHPLGCDPIVRRADLATDLRLSSTVPSVVPPAAAMLEALGVTVLPRHAPVSYLEPDGTRQGVAWRTKGNKTVFRIYDKQLEMAKSKHRVERTNAATGTTTLEPHPLAGPAGEVLRFEREWNPTSSKDFHAPGELLTSDLRSMFLAPWASWLKRSSNLTVCGETAAAEAIARKVHKGQLSAQQARNRLGNIALLDREVFSSAATGHDRRSAAAMKALRAAGIVFDRRLPRHASVEVGTVMLLAAGPWPSGEPETRAAPPASINDKEDAEQLAFPF